MAFVLDVSIAAAWALADETSDLADLAASKLSFETAWVPPLWWYEIRNVLVTNERRKRLAVADSDRFLEMIRPYPIQVDPHQDEELTLRLARRHNLSFYDAAYLAIALTRRLPLVTLDRSLQAAASAEGLPPLV